MLGDHRDIEILLVGGAAGMITGVLPPSRTTIDCDVMAYLPADAMARVELAAEQVADELGLASNWLNSDVNSASTPCLTGGSNGRSWRGCTGG